MFAIRFDDKSGETYAFRTETTYLKWLCVWIRAGGGGGGGVETDSRVLKDKRHLLKK